MIEAGYGRARGFSPAQLETVFLGYRRRRAEAELRELCRLAAGAQGRKPFGLMLRELKREIKGTRSAECGVRNEEPESETPLSAADFERMMREENE